MQAWKSKEWQKQQTEERKQKLHQQHIKQMDGSN
jgi:hypothetical protein